MKNLRKIAPIAGFCITAAAVLFAGVWLLEEYMLSVCLLLVLETAMAVLLHRAELWRHCALLCVQFLAAAAVQQIPLTILCTLLYIAATLSLQFIGTHKS